MGRLMTGRQKFGVLGTFFFAYLVLGSREQPWNDARQLHQVAESIVTRGAVDVQMRTPLERDGKFYAAHPLLVSLIHVPGVLVHKAAAAAIPAVDQPARAIGSHLGPSLLGALVCLLFVQIALELGVGFRAASLSTVVLGFATMVAVYARSPWSEITQTAAFAGFFLWLLRVAKDPSRKAALWFGIWVALLVNTKLVFALALPGAALFAGRKILQQHGRAVLARTIGTAALGALPGVIMVLGYNFARTHSLFGTGYNNLSGGEAFGEHVRVGLWGLFLSPGKSVFLYNLPLVVALLALPHVWRTRSRDWLVALLVTAAPVVFVYSRYSFWAGDWCWGPRYILFLVPIALLPAAFLLDDLLRVPRAWVLPAWAGVLALGLWVQIVGAAFYWDHFIRIAQDVQAQWLGQVVRTGAFPPDRGGACDPCFEDLHGLNWLPAFAPIEGHAWLLRHVVARDPWQIAEADAPWHRYTNLKMNIARSYAGARLDWWMLDFKGGLRPLGGLLIVLWAGGAAIGATFWLRSGSRAPQLRGDLVGKQDALG
jgi:hypothetical protein